jgi:hypothetical protein
MTLDAEQRRRLREAQRQVAEILDPIREARKIARAKARQKREKALVRSQGQRQPRERDPGYLAFLRRLPCVVGPIKGDCCGGRTDPAHIRFADPKAGRRNPGLSAKPDDKWCLPVCRFHHEAQHAYGNEAEWWAVEVGADPTDLARAFYAAYLAGEDGHAVLRRFSTHRETAQ